MRSRAGIGHGGGDDEGRDDPGDLIGRGGERALHVGHGHARARDGDDIKERAEGARGDLEDLGGAGGRFGL
jgi:hypothetical protein